MLEVTPSPQGPYGSSKNTTDQVALLINDGRFDVVTSQPKDLNACLHRDHFSFSSSMRDYRLLLL